MKAQLRPIRALLLCMMAATGAAAAAPATLVQTVTYDGETITMRLTRETLRGSNFEFLSQNSSGGYDTVTPVDERSYIGTIDGYPGAVSCGILQDDGQVRGAAYFDRGVTWFSLGTSVVETRALDYATFSSFHLPTSPTVASGQAGSTMYGYELGVDADHNYYTTAGSSTAATLEAIEYSVCLVRAIYMRDVLLRPYLGRVIVRATLAQDPYTGLNQGGYLDAVRLEWENNQTDTNPDLVAGVSPTKIGGGLAWVGVVGTGSGYSVNQSNGSGNFDVVFRHEMGHNWNCGHFVGGSPEGAGLMGGNAPARFSGCEAYNTLNHRDNRIAAGGILDAEGTYTAIELPPYASMDAGTFVQTVDSSLAFSVLANDHDANGQTISILSHDPTSTNGGSVTQQGQDLLYTAPGSYLGTDHFFYTVTDTVGRSAQGVVIVDVIPNDDLRLYLALDESSGTAANDQSVFDLPATLSGTDFATASTGGTYGSAVTLDGVDDHVQISNVSLNSNTVTITAWVKQGATQNPWSGIAFDRSSGAAGLNIGDGTELRYHWNNDNWGWNSGLTPPADTWTFVALVIEPSQATIYMDSGSGLQSAVNNATHNPATFGSTYVGWDPSNSSRHFNGSIDDVRIYNKALSQTEVQSIQAGGSAEGPSPFDGASDVTSPLLTWSPGASATGHDVYVGTSQSAVTNATQASPEFAGSTSSSQFLASLSDSTQYFWRIDTSTASSTLTGSVWSFTTGTLPTPGDTILVNFDRGGGESFAGGELIGPSTDDSSNWNAATGASGSLTGLIDNAGAASGAEILWESANTWGNNDGTADDEHRLAVGYLDDGDGANADGKGVLVTINNIPYSTYKVYGLFATDQNQGSGGSSGTVNFNVNGTWALGGNASTTAAAWSTINANNSNNGNYWTEIVPGSVQGNYWTVDSSGATCTIVGELQNGTNRGCLTAVIIEEIQAPVNNPPTWNTDPVNETDADENVAYNSTLADDASDPDAGDTLSYSMISGPAWLSVATNGNLSGTPSSGDVGTNQWIVRVSDNGGLTADASLNITVQATPTGDTTYNAIGENTSSGTASGGLAATASSDDSYETLTEQVTGGNPSKRRSQLEHRWTFSLTSGIATTLRVEAHHTANSEGDDFVFAYSTDGSSYTDALTVTKTADDNNEQTAALPSNLNGTVYIRVLDTDNSQGNSVADSLFVDLLAIDVTPLTGPPAAAGNPNPANGASGTSPTPTLTWDAAGGADSYDVYFGTSAPGTLQGNQPGTSFTPGSLTASTTHYWRVDTVNANGTTTGTAWSFTTGAGGSSTLFSDDFEDGNVDGWSISGNVSAHSAAANDGVFGAKLRNSASMTISVDTSSAGSVTLEYDRTTVNYDSGETLDVMWSTDGTNWSSVESTSSTTWGTTNVTLPAGAAGQAALQIRFSTNANRNNENAYVDNVSVTGS